MELRISNSTVFRILLLITAFLVLIQLVLALRTPLTWIGIAFFLALALAPLVEWLAYRMPKKSRGLAVALCC